MVMVEYGNRRFDITYINYSLGVKIMSEVETEIDAKVTLSDLADRISKLKTEKSRIEGQVESLEKQRASAEERCRALNVEPGELDKMIQVRRDTLYTVIQAMEGAVSDIELKRDQVQRMRD